MSHNRSDDAMIDNIDMVTVKLQLCLQEKARSERGLSLLLEVFKLHTG